MSNLKTYKFQDLYEMSSGISSKPEQAGHGTPFLSFSTVFNNYFLPESLPDLMDISDKEKEVYSIIEGDIFLTRTSETLDELGMSSVAIKDYEHASFSGFLKRLRPKQKDIVYHKFMAFYLRSKLFRKTMNNNAIMTLRASLNEQIFSYLDLILPKFDEQKKVGDFLYRLNQKIEINNRINAELGAMAKTLYDYWFVQFDFPNEEDKPYKTSGGAMVWNEELKREIPEGWEVKKLGDFCDIFTGKKDVNETDINGKYRFFSCSPKTFLSNDYLFDGDAIIIAGNGSYTGRTRFFRGKFDLYQRAYACTIKKEFGSIEIPYFYYTMKYVFEPNIIGGTHGSAIPYLVKSDIQDFSFSYSSIFINKIDKILAPILNKAIDLELENQKLSELRDWLLPMLMNGQVKVGE